MKKQLLTLCFTLLLGLGHIFAESQQPIYYASKFGIRSDGVTMNTRSIQFAIDWIAEQGGGTLRFWVGRYLTGSIHMKSNVSIELMEGAVLVGSTNPFDYDRLNATNDHALILAEGVENIRLIGVYNSGGVVDGQGRELGNNCTDLVHKGLMNDRLSNDRVGEGFRPRLLIFRECKNVEVENVTFRNAANWVTMYDQCENVTVNKVRIQSTAFWNNDGIDIVDCDGFLLTNSYIDASDDAICLKSHSNKKLCQNIEVRNCVARSSASGIKFGTMGAGGFRNVRIINNTVYDTYRSAITIQSVDGGICENILVDSLRATNVGNAIYLNIGARRDKQSFMNGITIRNLYCEVAATKPDAGYEYEGPIEDLPRNISPCGIIGLRDSKIMNVTLENIEIVFPGGGDPHYAYVGLDQLDKVPEMPKAYPEFSQHMELPAWGFFIRHVDGLVMRNIKLTALKKDYRTAIVMDDVSNHNISELTVEEPDGETKEAIFERK